MLTAALVLTGLMACRPEADFIVVNARVYTVDEAYPIAEAFAVRDGRFVAVGSSADVSQAYSSARVEDMRGATIVPGLIDAHGHLVRKGLSMINVDLVGTTSIEDILARLRERDLRLPEGAWIEGRGWDQNDWPEIRFPTRHDLDAVFPSRPVLIERVDGHMSWLNTAALNAIGYDSLLMMPSPVGGRIGRDENGDLNGLFLDTASDMVLDLAPPPSRAVLRTAISLAFEEAARVGLTGVHEPGVKLDTLILYKQIAAEGNMSLRIYALAEGTGPLFRYLCSEGTMLGYKDLVWTRAVKIYADGALGSRGAALLAPYTDDPGNSGLLIHPEAELENLVQAVSGCDLQPAVHAIGDRANRVALNMFESLGDSVRRELRPRLEHAQVLDPEDLDRVAELGIVASMQPTHATSDMYWAEDRLGPPRLAGAYAWNSLHRSGVRLAFGSDFPVETVNPLAGMYAAITRQDSSGWPDGGWLPDERVSRDDALRGFTINAAYAAFMENEVGSISTGKYADFVVFDRDIMQVPAPELLTAKVAATYLGGRRVYDAQGAR